MRPWRLETPTLSPSGSRSEKRSLTLCIWTFSLISPMEGSRRLEVLAASRGELERLYGLLRVSFDHVHPESRYAPAVPSLCQRLRDRGHLVVRYSINRQDLDWISEAMGRMRRGRWASATRAASSSSSGSTAARIPNSLCPWLESRKADGGSVYLARDVGAALERLARWDPALILYVVDELQVRTLSFYWKGSELRSIDKMSQPLHLLLLLLQCLVGGASLCGHPARSGAPGRAG